MVLSNSILRGFIVLILQEFLLAGWLVGKLVRKCLSQSFKSLCGDVKLIAVIINAVVVVVVARGEYLLDFSITILRALTIVNIGVYTLSQSQFDFTPSNLFSTQSFFLSF